MSVCLSVFCTLDVLECDPSLVSVFLLHCDWIIGFISCNCKNMLCATVTLVHIM